MSKVLILTGPGGSGKTTIARLLARRCGYTYLDGDREDTEFFPDGKQWLPKNADLLRKAHRKILRQTKELVAQNQDVVVDYIIFGQYQKFIDMFRQAFGDDLDIKVLMPSQQETVQRDALRETWTTGEDRITAVRDELTQLKDKIGSTNYLDTTDLTPESTLEKYFPDCR